MCVFFMREALIVERGHKVVATVNGNKNDINGKVTVRA